jgi:spermidine/putrescine transport system substrate-binding protein
VGQGGPVGGRWGSLGAGHLSRRHFLAASGAVAAGLAASGCARDRPGGSGLTSVIPIASPANPVLWPINAGNAPIAPDLEPERGGTLRIYNYPDYLNRKVLKQFRRLYADYDITLELITYNDSQEALAKMRTGTVPFDVIFMTYDYIGKLVYGDLVRPLQHAYIPNIVNVFPEFQNPFYDQEWRYSVPYTVYSTGIGWRADLVSFEPESLSTPYDVFWDPSYRGALAVLDDYREVLGMTILRDGGTDVNTESQAELEVARQSLLAMNQQTQPRVTISGYTDIPEGVLSLSQCWCGDMVTGQYYLPEGVGVDTLRYWFPRDGKGVVNNDFMVLGRTGENPVLAHHFLNYMLNPEVAMENFSFVGYQPPQVTMTPQALIDSGVVPPNLDTAIVRAEDVERGYRTLELPPSIDAEYQVIWQEFKAGA